MGVGSWCASEGEVPPTLKKKEGPRRRVGRRGGVGGQPERRCYYKFYEFCLVEKEGVGKGVGAPTGHWDLWACGTPNHRETILKRAERRA